MADTLKRGFASMDKKKQREIASKGGSMSGGNFKNNPQRASDAGRKGGKASHRGRAQDAMNSGNGKDMLVIKDLEVL